ncbi:MAG TPA: alanine racemase [Chloroflexota bacterium]|nr:alanine racemase [Chloroflexota bacterium]
MRVRTPGAPEVSSPPQSSDAGLRVTRAYVDLDAIEANVRVMRSLAPRSQYLAVVKANGYGHGAVLVAAAALRGGADRLGVYTVQEGAQLRRAGVEAPILVFGAFGRYEATEIVRYHLTPTISRPEQAEWLQAASPSIPIPYHFKIDTGLTRAGVLPAEAPALIRSLSSFPCLVPEGIFTHFACADEPQRPENARQLATFLATVESLAAEGLAFPLKHAAASAATMAMPESHLDMVRCGISTYGCNPSRLAAANVRLTPALTLRSEIVRVTSLPAGTGVGYGHDFHCSAGTRIALVPLGYGDGLPRSFGCGNGCVLLRGESVRVVGRVSMDQITVDVTDLPHAEVGDEITVIGGQGERFQTAEDVADQCGTINYEVLTRLMPRVPRVYHAEGEVVAVADLLDGSSTAG